MTKFTDECQEPITPAAAGFIAVLVSGGKRVPVPLVGWRRGAPVFATNGLTMSDNIAVVSDGRTKFIYMWMDDSKSYELVTPDEIDPIDIALLEGLL